MGSGERSELVGKRIGAYAWFDKRGWEHELSVRRTEYGVEIEETVYHGPPTLYDSNTNRRSITIPADPDLLKKIARVFLNIVVYEKRAVNSE